MRKKKYIFSKLSIFTLSVHLFNKIFTNLIIPIQFCILISILE